MIGNQIAGFFSVAAPPIPPSNFESIQTYTVGAGNQTTITFSSIPSTYKHLQIRGILNGTVSDTDIRMRVGNGSADTGTSYSYHGLFGNGGSAGAYAGTSSDYMAVGATPTNSTTFTGLVIDVLDYANVNKYKTVRTLTGLDTNGGGAIRFLSGNWRSTSAINTIAISCYSGDMKQYSSFALYGISGA